MRQRAPHVRLLPLATSVILCTVGFALGTSERVAACSCVALTDEEAFASADAVFTGELVDVVTPPGDSFSSSDPERFVFEVDAVFKGAVFARQAVVTARDGASCGLEISGRGPFVVFARTEPDGITGGAVSGELYSNLCSGTRELAMRAIPAGFGAPTAPAAGSSPVGHDAGGVPIVWFAVAGGVVVLGAVAVGLSSRRRARTAS